MSPRRKMPSPALVVAVVALVAALGGSAYAVKKIGTKQLAKNAVSTKKIKNGAVTAPKLGPGVGRVVAYAEVTPSGNVVPSRSAGITNANVDLEETSAFCFYGLSFEYRTVIATPVYEGQQYAPVATVEEANPQFDCTGRANPRLEVATYYADALSSDDFSPQPFKVAFID